MAAAVLLLALAAASAGCGSGGGAPFPDPADPAGGPCAAAPLPAGQTLEESRVFQGDFFGASEDGYPVFRIPSVVTTASGVVLAFAEGRQSLQDPGAGLIDLVMKRSLDCGRTWTETSVLAENGAGDAHNPTAVVVPGPGRRSTVWLFYGQRGAWRPPRAGEVEPLDLPVEPGFGPGTASVRVVTSDDDGATWSAPRDLTRSVKDPGWMVTSPGPGLALVTRWGGAGAPAGRMVVPGWYTRDGPGGSFVMLSDDRGETWRRGGLPEPLTDEPQVVELADGTLLLDARQSGDGAARVLFRSRDGGRTWGAPEAGLEMPRIMSSVIRYSAVRDGGREDLLLHSGIETDAPFPLRRNVRVWLSTDEGRTWTHETEIFRGFAQYSVLIRLDDGTVGLLYESLGASGGQAGLDIRFARFSLAHLGRAE